ncbi:MAG: hypothetical protein EA402_10710 [Planctomycetota bacterium]|nr:MAG: hypothetical protein EA402_10710 [Planctomycetota bacterium]
MQWAVFGAGLVGSYLGAAGGASHACRRRQGPLRERVCLADGVREWAPQPFPQQTGEMPVLVASRAHHTPWQHCQPHWLAAQNGLGQGLPVLVCFLAVDRDAEGRIVSSTGSPPRVVCGPVAASWQPIFQAWRGAGLVVETVADIRPAQWEKAILNATLGPLCLASGRSMPEVMADATARQLVLAGLAEGEAIAAANGIALAPDLQPRALAFFNAMGDHRPSVLNDPAELAWVLPPLLAAAQRQRLPAPALQEIFARASSLCQGPC